METWNKFEADKLEYALGGWNVLDQDHDGCVAAEETIRSLNQQNLFRSDHPFVMPWLTHRDSLARFELEHTRKIVLVAAF